MYFTSLDETQEKENPPLSLVHLQPAFGLLLVGLCQDLSSVSVNQLASLKVQYFQTMINTDSARYYVMYCQQVGLTASLLALFGERLLHATKQNST